MGLFGVEFQKIQDNPKRLLYLYIAKRDVVSV